MGIILPLAAEHEFQHILDPDIPKRLPHQPVARALGVEPTEEEIARSMKAMANAKEVGSNSLPV